MHVVDLLAHVVKRPMIVKQHGCQLVQHRRGGHVITRGRRYVRPPIEHLADLLCGGSLQGQEPFEVQAVGQWILHDGRRPLGAKT